MSATRCGNLNIYEHVCWVKAAKNKGHTVYDLIHENVLGLETAQSVTCLPHKQKEMSLELQHPSKKPSAVHACNPSTRRVTAGRTPGLLASKSSPVSEFLVQGETLPQKYRRMQLKKKLNVELWPSQTRTYAHTCTNIHKR